MAAHSTSLGPPRFGRFSSLQFPQNTDESNAVHQPRPNPSRLLRRLDVTQWDPQPQQDGKRPTNRTDQARNRSQFPASQHQLELDNAGLETAQCGVPSSRFRCRTSKTFQMRKVQDALSGGQPGHFPTASHQWESHNKATLRPSQSKQRRRAKRPICSFALDIAGRTENCTEGKLNWTLAILNGGQFLKGTINQRTCDMKRRSGSSELWLRSILFPGHSSAFFSVLRWSFAFIVNPSLRCMQ